ncbi:MAG: DUF2892 domain-containing protein [Saprospiraceae bacterium]|nr:MAG: hypothetical protein UZ09_BCD002002039 [Bacteroidetes bacterium OLB9]MCO6463486.1 DUF2892 domain-containing protein [Saprospiraceae bacterium]
MTKNVGRTDKLIRLAVVALIAILYYTGKITGTTAIVLGIVAIIFALTAFLSFCPIWAALGINTNKK